MKATQVDALTPDKIRDSPIQCTVGPRPTVASGGWDAEEGARALSDGSHNLYLARTNYRSRDECIDWGGEGHSRRGRVNSKVSVATWGRYLRLPRNADEIDTRENNTCSRTRRTAVAVAYRPHRGPSSISRRLPQRAPVRSCQVQL